VLYFNPRRFNGRGLIYQHGLRVIFRIFQSVFLVKRGLNTLISLMFPA